ncbi:MAG: helix-turn-helix transcriptional regulator [Methylomicrobium sp.]|nr:helix-turn-helix transcriptional regulator [Methylomicrobium sp.]
MKIGEIIKRRRCALDLTQVELAQKAKLAQSKISQLESGVSDNVTIDNLRSIAKALNCALVDLLPDADKTIKK